MDGLVGAPEAGFREARGFRDTRGAPRHLVGDRPGERGGKPRIRCPACAGEPQKDDHWSCACLYSWNTSDTLAARGERRWTETQCPKCQVWSRHIDWYAADDDDLSRP